MPPPAAPRRRPSTAAPRRGRDLARLLRDIPCIGDLDVGVGALSSMDGSMVSTLQLRSRAPTATGRRRRRQIVVHQPLRVSVLC